MDLKRKQKDMESMKNNDLDYMPFAGWSVNGDTDSCRSAEEAVELNGVNAEEKMLCIFLVDTSGSMAGTKMDMVKERLRRSMNDIMSAGSMSQKLDVAVIAFGSDAKVVAEPGLVENMDLPELQAGGETDMAGGITRAIELIGERKEYYVDNGIAFRCPWIIMLSDGHADVTSVIEQVREDRQFKNFFIQPFAVGDDFDMATLDAIASDHVLELKDTESLVDKLSFLSWPSGLPADTYRTVDNEMTLDPWASWVM